MKAAQAQGPPNIRITDAGWIAPKSGGLKNKGGFIFSRISRNDNGDAVAGGEGLKAGDG